MSAMQAVGSRGVLPVGEQERELVKQWQRLDDMVTAVESRKPERAESAESYS